MGSRFIDATLYILEWHINVQYIQWVGMRVAVVACRKTNDNQQPRSFAEADSFFFFWL